MKFLSSIENAFADAPYLIRQKAKALYVLFVFLILMVLSVTALGIRGQSAVDLPVYLLSNSLAIVFICLAIWLLHRGIYEISANLTVLLCLGAVLIGFFSEGAQGAPHTALIGYVYYFPIFVTIGAFFTSRLIHLCVTITLIAAIYLYYRVYLPDFRPEFVHWAREGVVDAAHASLILYGISLATVLVSDRAMKRVQRELDRNRHLNDDLERKVRERTADLQLEKSKADELNKSLRGSISEIERLAVEARRANVAKSQFLATMSHEIRTPLNGIMGMLDIVLESRLTDEQRRFLFICYESSRALKHIISDVLDIAKIESGTLDLTAESTDIRDLIREVVESLMPAALEKRLRLTHSISSDVPGRVDIDPIRFRQIIVNLVSNALKFTRTGSVSIDVSVSAVIGKRLVVKVIDTGIGIPAENMLSIFEPFSQGDGSITREFGGTGLGLAISRQLARKMDGDIVADSEAGKGSTFVLNLPLADEGTSGQQFEFNNHPEALPPETSDAPIRVMVVEDNEVNRMVVTKMLQRRGFVVIEVADGETALTMLDKLIPDCVLMDIHMPGIDGFETTRRIRNHPDHSLAAVPVIALTADALRESHDHCMSIGMQGFLTKPIESSKLMEILRRTLPKIPALP